MLHMHHIAIMKKSSRLSADQQATMREIEDTCVIARIRLMSRIMTGIFDEEFRPLGLISSQQTLLGLIMRLGEATRAEIGRANFIDRSTLTRNLKVLIDAGWVEEVASQVRGRSRPLRLSKAGEDLYFSSVPAWRAGQERAAKLFGPAALGVIKTVADEFLRG
jgi:DNA-binding MarR family transcriptional regulator